jgi:eukaryotic-like serine/threonine-protein kinase
VTKRSKRSPIIFAIVGAILMTGIFAAITVQPRDALGQKNATSVAPNSTPLNSNATSVAGANTAFLTYQNSTVGMKIQYPSNWTKQTTPRGVSFAVVLGRNTTNHDNFLAKLNASALRGFPTNMTIKAMADRVVNSYRHFLPGFQIQSYTNATLAGNNAIKIVYTYTDPKNNRFTATDTATIKNDKLYVIQYYYYTKSPKQQTYPQTLHKMVDSFQVVK